MSADVPVIAYFRGDDGFTMDAAVAALTKRLEQESGAPPDRWRAAGTETSAADIAVRVATAPLFGGGTVAVVVDPAPLLRSKAEREALDGAIRNVAPGNALVFLEQGDAGARRSAALQGLEASVQRAGGDAKEFRAPREGQLAAWIEGRANERSITLEPGAAKELARRVGGFVREGDVDRQRQGALAVGELEKLSLYRPFDPVTEADVRALVSEVVPDSTWAFLDAVADRKVAVAAPLLDRLLETTPEPVLLVQTPNCRACDDDQDCNGRTAWLMVLAAVFLTLAPRSFRPITGVEHHLEHFLAFTLLGLVFATGYPSRRPCWRSWASPWPACSRPFRPGRRGGMPISATLP